LIFCLMFAICPQVLIVLLVLGNVSWTWALRARPNDMPALQYEHVNVRVDPNASEAIHIYRGDASTRKAMTTELLFSSDVKLHLGMYAGEFGEELLMVIPFAYHLHLRGKVASTTGCGNMSAFYWWSPNHTNNVECQRRAGAEVYGTDEITVAIGDIFNNRPPPDTFTMPPHLQHFFKMPPLITNNDYMNSPKQLVILNKYSSEWDGPPVNFLGFDEVRDILFAFRGACGPTAGIVYISSSASVTPDMAMDWQSSESPDFGGQTELIG